MGLATRIVRGFASVSCDAFFEPRTTTRTDAENAVTLMLRYLEALRDARW